MDTSENILCRPASTEYKSFFFFLLRALFTPTKIHKPLVDQGTISVIYNRVNPQCNSTATKDLLHSKRKEKRRAQKQGNRKVKDVPADLSFLGFGPRCSRLATTLDTLGPGTGNGIRRPNHLTMSILR